MDAAERDQRARMMLDIAWESMEEGRSHRGKQVMRSLRRSWQYAGGKKKVAKIAIGIGFGAIFVGISVATAGAGAPVIAALAVGSFLVSQMSDAGFAKLSGRKFRGKGRTQNWVEEHRKLNPANQQENLKATDERAHKTIRRAFEHYRRGVRKARDAKAAFDATGAEGTCDAAADMVLATFSVAHHFDKSIVYEFPAVFLCQTLLSVHKDNIRVWNTVEPNLRTTAGKILEGHQKDASGAIQECESENCFVAVDITQTAARAWPALWDDAEIEKATKALKDLDEQLAMAGFDPDPPQAGPAGRGEARAQLLFQDAGKKYHENRKRVHVKVKHGIANMWARKTSGERAGFVVGKVVGAGLSAGGGGISGGMSTLPVGSFQGGPWFEALIEAGLQGSGHVGDLIIGRATQDEETAAGVDVEHHDGSTKSGAETQSAVQKAAIHIYEITKLIEELKTSDRATDCDSAVARLRDIFKIRHHLVKTQEYLADATGKVVLLGEALVKKTEAMTKVQQEVYKLAVTVVARDTHGNCGKVCYGPAGAAQSTRAIRPLA